MEIRHPEYMLFGLALLVFLLFLSAKIRRKKALGYSSSYSVKNVSFFWRLIDSIPEILFVMIFSCLLVALAAPFKRELRTVQTIEGRVLVPCIDVSGSMSSTTAGGKVKLDVIKEILEEFIQSRIEEDAIGLTAFSGGGDGWGAGVIQYPTIDKDLARKASNRIVSQLFGGSTAIGEGIFVSIISILEESWNKKLSDEVGNNNAPAEFDMLRLWNATNALNIPFEELLQFAQTQQGEDGQTYPFIWADVSSAPDDEFVISEAVRLTPPEQNKNKSIILFSDGDSNTGMDPLKAIWLAQRLGIKIYYIDVVAAGTQLDDIKRRLILAIKSTGGEYFRGESYEDVRKFFNEISKIEKNTIYPKNIYTEEESYEFFAKIAGLLIIILIIVEIIFIKN